MTDGFEVGRYYPEWGTIETGEGKLNVPVGVVVDGECLACQATELPSQHEAAVCPYLVGTTGTPGRPRDPRRDPTEREDRDPVQNQPPTGEGGEPAAAG